MAIDLEKVKTALHAAISRSQGPTEAQVLEISSMTRIEEALKQIQRMIQRRVQYPGGYSHEEIYHTVVLIHKCLAIASRDFVAFCTTLLPAISVLTRYVLDPAAAEISGLIRIRAGALYRDLVNPARISEKRHVSLGETVPAIAPPPTHVTPHPLPTPPPEYKKLPTMIPATTGLLTPDPSPPKAFSNPSLHGNSKEAVKRIHDSFDNQFTSLIFLKDDEISRKTFIKEDLEIILRILDQALLTDTSHRIDPDNIVKALTLVHRCLYWGSSAFVAHFQEKKPYLKALRRHPAPLVRSRTDTVVNLLDDDSRLQQERRSREQIMVKWTNSSQNYSNNHQPSSNSLSDGIMRGNIQEPVIDLSQHVKILGTHAVSGGGFADVWEGEYTTETGVEIVAIKILRRLKKYTPERLDKHRNRELRAWRNLSHKYITPFYGIIVDGAGEIGMVSPYYSEGNIVEYLRKNNNIDPLVMFQKVAEGIAYLHSMKIVHGDIKGSNVMISQGSPMLIDFGLAQFIDGIATGYTTSSVLGSLRWSAPELLDGESGTPRKTENSDVYAFASFCIEIVTLRNPYHPRHEPQVMVRILRGEPPDRPSMEERWSPSDELWDLLQKCWRNNPQDRPDIAQVRRALAEFSPSSYKSGAKSKHSR